MDGLETLILNEVRRREINTVCITYIWNLIHGTKEPIYRKETNVKEAENRLVVAKGKEEGVG